MKVRYYGHVGELTGYGHAAREMCRALLTAGVELEIRPLEPRVNLAVLDDGASLPLAPHLRKDSDLTTPDAVIVHTLPFDCHKVMMVVGRGNEPIVLDRPWIAYTTWEGITNVGRELDEELSFFHQVWVPSSRTASSLATQCIDPVEQRYVISLTDPKDGDVTPIKIMPHAYDAERPLVAPRIDPLDIAPYIFLYVGAWNSRKNPAGLIRAFAYAGFAPHEAELWIQSTGTPLDMLAVAHAQTGCHETCRVRLFDEPLTAAQMSSQYWNADCFVTATRGEAWNLPAFEAMLHKRHIIVPAPWGSGDFLKDTSATLVYEGMAMPAARDVHVTGKRADGALELASTGAQGLSARHLWWEPDLCELAQAMRDAYANKRRDLAIYYDVAERYGYAAIGKLAVRYLEELPS